MFGGVNLFSSSTHFAGPHAPAPVMGGAARGRLRYGIVKPPLALGEGRVGRRPPQGSVPSRLPRFPGRPSCVSSVLAHSLHSLYVHPSDHNGVFQRHSALPAAVVHLALLRRALFLLCCVRRFPAFRLIIHRLPSVVPLRPVHVHTPHRIRSPCGLLWRRCAPMLLFVFSLRRGCRFVLRPVLVYPAVFLSARCSLCLSLCVLSPVCCTVLCTQSLHVPLCCCALPSCRVPPSRCSLRCCASDTPWRSLLR